MSADRPHSVAALLEEAQRAISKARYDAALEWLQQAALLAPEDGEIRQLLARTDRASQRHQAAAERHQTALSWSRKIEDLIESDELEAARAQLREAGLALGKHEAFSALERRIAEREDAARHGLASELAVKARTLLDAGDRRGALKVAEQSLRFAPVPEAQKVRARAGAELDREAERRQYRQAVAEAVDDVERLLGARELARAGQRLAWARDQLGSHKKFEELGRRIDRAKSDLRFRQRVEWAERRSKEADGLVAEAARLSLKGAYGEAIERLEAARGLDPSRPDLGEKFETARAALERQLARRRRTEELSRQLAEIKSLLDALRLEAAEQAIRRGTREFGEPERFAQLATRLERLREVERTGQAQPPASLPEDGETETAMLRRQQMLAAAYSWKQTFLYPFRGFGRTAFWTLLALLALLDVLAAAPLINSVFKALSAAATIAAGGLVPHVVRATIDGRNLLPSWSNLADPIRWTRDLGRFAGLLVFSGLPLILLVATRPWHGVPGVGSGFLVWLIVAILGWLGAAILTAAVGAAEAFGRRHALRLSRHIRGLLAGGSDALLVIDAVFLIGLLAVVAAHVPVAPWLFTPLSRAITVYGLLLVPHLIGVLIRRHRLELSKVYRQPPRRAVAGSTP